MPGSCPGCCCCVAIRTDDLAVELCILFTRLIPFKLSLELVRERTALVDPLGIEFDPLGDRSSRLAAEPLVCVCRGSDADFWVDRSIFFRMVFELSALNGCDTCRLNGFLVTSFFGLLLVAETPGGAVYLYDYH